MTRKKVLRKVALIAFAYAVAWFAFWLTQFALNDPLAWWAFPLFLTALSIGVGGIVLVVMLYGEG